MEHGRAVLRTRSDGATELRINGVFVMDDVETSSERLLATRALAAPAVGDVLVGGLGLGFTVRELLSDARVQQVVVAEIEPTIVQWMRDGVIAGADLLDDPRVRVEVADVRRVVAASPAAAYDSILLDVDNGPRFLVLEDNAEVYRSPFLELCASRLRDRGTLCIWSQADSPDLRSTLSPLFDEVSAEPISVALQGRDEAYWLIRADRPRRRPARRPDNVELMSTQDDYRIEHDTMGEVKVPAQALWRAQTQRAVENFPISGTPLEPQHIKALAEIKAACATANAELGVIEQDMADAIVAAAAEVAAGEHDAEFPIDVFQTGSGTSSNMNTNEVLATLATAKLGRDVHPNDHVNASQSSNDVFPTSIHVAATAAATFDLVPALDHLAGSLERKAASFETVVKSGRTHLMDATPVTLGQEFGGYAAQVRRGIERVEASLPRVAEVPLGGTAVGTGINTPAGFPQRVIEILADDTALPLTEASNHFEAQGARDGLVELSGQLRTIAVSLIKICNDLRLMGSGPRAGFAEIALPDLQPGSSIMPGKVNPVLPEATLMVCAQVIGNDAAIATAGSSGAFELNVMMPVMARNLLESIRLLANTSRLLADRCIDGIEADVDRCREYAESSPSIVTPLNKYIGYENAAKVAKQSVKERRTIREIVIEHGYVEQGLLTESQLDEALDVLSMTHP